MSKSVKYSVLFVLASLPVLTFAKGGVNGGGGRGVVCRDKSGQIRTAELLDLWEARVIDQQKLRPALPTFHANLVDAIKRYYDVLGYGDVTEDPKATQTEIEKVIKEIDGSTTFLPDSVKLEEVNDSMEPAVPVGCKVEQLAHLYEDRRLLIQKSIWDKLNPQNKAALIIHEMIYFERRTQGDTTSRTARRWVGAFFSVKGLKPVLADVKKFEAKPSKSGIRCVTNYRAMNDMEELQGNMADFWIDTEAMKAGPETRMLPIYFRSIPGQYSLETYTKANVSSQLVDVLNGSERFAIPAEGYRATMRADGELDRSFNVQVLLKKIDGKTAAYVSAKDADGKLRTIATFCGKSEWDASRNDSVMTDLTPATSNITY